MTDRTTRVPISASTFLTACLILGVTWLIAERFDTLWPFAVGVPLALLVNVVALVSPNGSVFWVLTETLKQRRENGQQKP